MGKYAIELLRQSKASRNEISQTIQFIVDQANSASEWTQEKVTLEHKITELEATIKVLRETKLKLTEEKDTASAEIERLKAELEVKNPCSSLSQGYASGNEDPLNPRDKHPGELMFFGKKLLSSVTPGN